MSFLSKVFKPVRKVIDVGEDVVKGAVDIGKKAVPGAVTGFIGSGGNPVGALVGGGASLLMGSDGKPKAIQVPNSVIGNTSGQSTKPIYIIPPTDSILSKDDMLADVISFKIGDQDIKLVPKSVLNYWLTKDKNRVYEESVLSGDAQIAAQLLAARNASEPSTIDKFTQILGLGKDIAGVTSYITGDKPEELWNKVTSNTEKAWNDVLGWFTGDSSDTLPKVISI